MARYRSYGNLDDQHVTDGDMAFVRMVSRINPEQLQQGDVYYSQNGRMDNDRAWVPRKGLNVFNQALTIGTVLTLPFTLNDASPPTYDDSTINGVYGSAYIEDVASGAGYIIILTNTKALLINVDDPDAQFLYVRPDGSSVFLRPDGVSLYIIPPADEVTYPGSSVIDQQVEVLQALDKVFVFFGDQTAWQWDGDLTGGLAFTEVSSGAYTAISVDNTPSNAVCASGVVTVSETAHGRSEGDILTIYDPGSSALVEGDRYEISVVDANSYTFTAEIADGTYSLTLGGKQPVSGGYIHMPNAEWGVHHQGRLILPYARTTDTGTSNDELIFSDIFDPQTYDPILNQLRFGSGSYESLVGVSPLLEDRLLVLCRHSVHLVTGVSGSLEDLTNTEITREVGCVARKTIREIGGTIMWLSDNGVYSVVYGQEHNLLANAIPISEPIENYMRLINWEYAHNAIAVYTDNRYYLAVPLGSSEVNNAIFVYNFLNQGWESIDTFPKKFDIYNMIVAPKDGRNRLFIINRAGAVHLADEVKGADRYQLSVEAEREEQIDGKLIPRRYTMGTMDIKRFNRATILCEAEELNESNNLPADYKAPGKRSQASSLSIGYTTQDPDSYREEFKVVNVSAEEDYNIKTSIRKRGYGIQIIFKTAAAKVRGLTVDAILSSRNHVDRN